MRWFGRRRRARGIEVPPRPEISIRAEAEEGVLLSGYALRMSLKNRIIVDALDGGVDYDEETYEEVARAGLLALAEEADESAARVSDELAGSEFARGRSLHQHDYRSRDAGNLRRRTEVYREVAALLRAAAGSDARVRELVASARSDAWGDVGAVVLARAEERDRAERSTPIGTEHEREAGRELVARDLRVLRLERERDGRRVSEA